VSRSAYARGCLSLVSTIARGAKYEPDMLFDDLLPTLRELWPDCPLHTIIADAFYDKEPCCRDLVERWSIQPIIARYTRRETDVTLKRGAQLVVIDGVPQCPTCGATQYWRQDGFYSPKQRIADGRTWGVIAPNVKQAPTAHPGPGSTTAHKTPTSVTSATRTCSTATPSSPTSAA
jgi:YgiT-type zinc finger domain-containing protein